MQSGGSFCVVLGGGGFLGINLCRRLAAAGHRVLAFGHRGLFSEALTSVEFRQGNFADRAAVADALQGADVAFHLVHSTVPYSANLNITRDVQENVLPSLAFLDVAHEAEVRRVVFLSSGGTIYGRPFQIPTEETAPTEPVTAYGISKLAIEKYLALYELHHALDYRVLRVANPFGPFQVAVKKQGLIAAILFRAMCARPVEVWGDGSIVRDFIFVDDVIDALELAAVHTGDERIFNIGSGVGRSVRDVLITIEQLLGRKLDIARKDSRAVDIPVSVLSVKRAREKLDWSPRTSFEAGVARTIAWWKNNIDSLMHTLPANDLQRKAADCVD
jgi:UDP-glucose 4-epimerase